MSCTGNDSGRNPVDSPCGGYAILSGNIPIGYFKSLSILKGFVWQQGRETERCTVDIWWDELSGYYSGRFPWVSFYSEDTSKIVVVAYDTASKFMGRSDTLTFPAYAGNIAISRIYFYNLDFVDIPGGTFRMGGFNVTPIHDVNIGAFTISSTEITQEQYIGVMGVNPSYFAGKPQNPVENVTWYDAALFCNALSKLHGRDTAYSYSEITGAPGAGCSLVDLQINHTGHAFRLPTEAEWEYACRGGTIAEYYWGGNYPLVNSGDTLGLDSNTIWIGNSLNKPQKVGTKVPNSYGLFDMSGNIWEWCNDWHDAYDTSKIDNPLGPSSGYLKSIRGGSCISYVGYLRSAYRHYAPPAFRYEYYGFRVVCR